MMSSAQNVTQAELTSLLQMQAEAVGLLRNPIRNERDLLRAKDDLASHNTFITSIGRLATRLQVPLEIVFQCLMIMSTSSSSSSPSRTVQADFDRQARQGNVPMHQAKVLKRDGVLEIQPKIEAAVPQDKLAEMISFSSSLRTLLRMKVEDGNDLSMARRAISLADDYMQRISKFANGNPQLMWKLFNANDEAEFAMLLGIGSMSGNEDGAMGNSTANSAFQGTLAPLPQPITAFPHAVELLCKKSLLSATVAVAERQQALANLEHWFRLLSVVVVVDEEEEEDDDDDNEDVSSASTSNKAKKFTPEIIRAIFASAAFRKSISLHVGEKRSALCRSACDIVSTLLQNVYAMDLMVAAGGSGGQMPAEIKESLVAWLEVLLKQVHITVAAIATATDATVRDMFVATGGNISLMNLTAQVATSASQPELQRKAIGYLALGAVAHIHVFDVEEVDPAAKCAIIAAAAAKLLQSSSEAVRRAARVAGIVCGRLTPAISIAGWDIRVEKAAAADARVVLGSACSAGTANFELSALKYAEPCSVSRYCAERECTLSLSASNNNENSIMSSGAGPSPSFSSNSASSSLLSAGGNNGIHFSRTGSNPGMNNINNKPSTAGGAAPAAAAAASTNIFSSSSSSAIKKPMTSSSTSSLSSVQSRVNSGLSVNNSNKPGFTSIRQQQQQQQQQQPFSSSSTSSSVVAPHHQLQPKQSSLSSHIQNQRRNMSLRNDDDQELQQDSSMEPVIVYNNSRRPPPPPTPNALNMTSTFSGGSNSSSLNNTGNFNNNNDNNNNQSRNGPMPLSLSGTMLSQTNSSSSSSAYSSQNNVFTMNGNNNNNNFALRSREPASPQTEFQSNRSAIPTNTAVNTNQQNQLSGIVPTSNNNNNNSIMSSALKRKITTSQQSFRSSSNSK